MKTAYYIVILAFFSTSALAQEGDIQIEQDDKIVELLDIYEAFNKTSEFYRIQVGFVSSNQKANDLRSLVSIDFPNLTSRVDFESPTYRVKVGRFKNKLEAERKFIEVRKKYPNAMLLKPKKSTR